MPEVKNMFSQGKMNLDLDERLIPDGQYREALNIDVSNSEGSDVGVIQNIKGNSSVSDLGSFNDSCVCVGSISDEKTNKIYWFVHCDDRDGIVQYDAITGQSFYLLVDILSQEDIKPFLKFTGKPITGINIIDDYLFWTDGDNEPKKVNITRQLARQKQGDDLGLSFNNQSLLDVNGQSVGFLKEEHITVIKRKPLAAPFVKIVSSKDNTEQSIFKKTFPRFCYRYKYQDGEYSAFSPFTNVVFNPEYVDDFTSLTAFATKEPYNTTMLNYISSIEISGFNRADTPEDVVQVDILYKQENSSVVYSVASIKTTDAAFNASSNFLASNANITYESDIKGSFILTAENVRGAIAENQMLRSFDNVPRKALAQEITGNRIVYGNYFQNYDLDNTVDISASFEDRIIFKKGRPVEKHVKSERDYQLGVLFGDKYGRETPIFTSENATVNIPYISEDDELSASRYLALNASLNTPFPSWASYYKFYVKSNFEEYYNLVMDRSYLPPTSTEFENDDEHIYISFASTDRNKISEDDYITMKRAIDPIANVQIPEENKFKILDISNEPPEAIAFKFYSLGSFANNEDNIFTDLSEDSSTGLFPSNPAGELVATQRVDQETDTIIINKLVWLQQLNGENPIGDGTPLTDADAESAASADKPEEVKGLYMSWSSDGQQSTRYKITSVYVNSSSHYVIKLSKPIKQQDALIANLNGLDALGELSKNEHLKTDLLFKIERREKWDSENFSGKFFVKIAANELAKEFLVGEVLDEVIAFTVLSSAKTFFWADKPSGEVGTDGIFNNQNESLITNGYYATSTGNDNETPNSIHTIGDLTNTPEAWDALLDNQNSGLVGRSGMGIFIDAMYFAGGNASADLFGGHVSAAKDSGQTHAGHLSTYYPTFKWSFNNINLNSYRRSNMHGGFKVMYNEEMIPSQNLTHDSIAANWRYVDVANESLTWPNNGLPTIYASDFVTMWSLPDAVISQNQSAIDGYYDDQGIAIDLFNGDFYFEAINHIDNFPQFSFTPSLVDDVSSYMQKRLWMPLPQEEYENFGIAEELSPIGYQNNVGIGGLMLTGSSPESGIPFSCKDSSDADNFFNYRPFRNYGFTVVSPNVTGVWNENGYDQGDVYDETGSKNIVQGPSGTDPDGNPPTLINGLEGIIQCTDQHSNSGPRSWVSGRLYDNSSNRSQKAEEDVTYEAERFYIHVSIAETGDDLFNKDIFPDGVDVSIKGLEGIAGYLQGIWGGGAFTKKDGTTFGDSDIQFVEMEGHYGTSTQYAWDGREPAPLPSEKAGDKSLIPLPYARNGNKSKYFNTPTYGEACDVAPGPLREIVVQPDTTIPFVSRDTDFDKANTKEGLVNTSFSTTIGNDYEGDTYYLFSDAGYFPTTVNSFLNIAKSSETSNPFDVLGKQRLKYSNYSTAPEGTVLSKVLGYDALYADLHINQWKFSDEFLNPFEMQQFFSKLTTIGEEFTFANDPSNEKYKILKTTKKHLYNHTTWRTGLTYKDGWAPKNDGRSVEEAVVAWADRCNADGVVERNADNEQFYQDMLDALEDFGSTRNRRLCYVVEINKDPRANAAYNPIGGGNFATDTDNDGTNDADQLPDVDSFTFIEFVNANSNVLTTEVTKNPVIWETEADQTIDLNIYYEASDSIPTKLTNETVELFAPVGCKVEFENFEDATDGRNNSNYLSNFSNIQEDDAIVTFRVRPKNNVYVNEDGAQVGGFVSGLDYSGRKVRFIREDGSFTTATILSTSPLVEENSTYLFTISVDVDASNNTRLSWYNSICDGRGVESNRIRDGFNEMQISSGARASATLEEPYAEEHRKNGLIYSGLYNSNSGTNNLNQFIQAEKITKDINPTYGSIQKLYSRSTDLVTFCEDRVVKVLANKDALFNADGNAQLVASQNVLGQTVPFVGDYGISKNPESFAKDSYRAYFTDAQRGAVLRLSMDGLTAISSAGMHDWFRDNLDGTKMDDISLVGSFDDYRNQYNITIKDKYHHNLIQNAFISEGTNLTTTVGTSPSVVINGDINGGINLYETPFSNIPNETVNSELSTGNLGQIYITNYPELPEGSIQAYVPGADPTPQADAIYSTSYEADGVSTIHNANIFSTASDDPFGSHPFEVYVGMGQPGGIGDITRSVYSASSNIAQTPFYETNVDVVGGLRGIKFAFPMSGGSQSVQVLSNFPPNPYNNPTDQISQDIINWTTDPLNIINSNNYTQEMIDLGFANYIENTLENKVDYSDVRNNTIFDREEFRIEFELRATGNPINSAIPAVSLQLYDLGSDGVGAIGSDGAISPDIFTALDSYGEAGLYEFGSFYQASSSGLVEFPPFQFGAEGNITKFRKYSCIFRARSLITGFPESIIPEEYKEQLNIAINRLAFDINIEYEGSGDEPKPEIFLTNVKVVKHRSLQTPYIPESGETIAEVPAIPEETIPAWAEVSYGASEGTVTPINWNGYGNGTTSVYGLEQIFGPENPGEIVEHTGLGPDGGETATYKVGESNGVVNFGQYLPDNEIGNSEPYNTPDGPVPALWETQQTQAILQADDFNSAEGCFLYHDSFPGSAGISQELETPFVHDNWYCVDVVMKKDLTQELLDEGFEQNFSQPYIAGVLGGSDEIIAAQVAGASHTDSNPNYPINSFGKVVGGGIPKSMRMVDVTDVAVATSENFNIDEDDLYRCIFQYKDHEDADPQKLNVKIWGEAAPAAGIIKSVKMFDISEGVIHQYPNGWGSVPLNVYGVHALSNFVDNYSPYSIYRKHTFLKNGKINWNLSSYSTTDSNWSKRIKQVNNDLPSTQIQNGTEEYTFSFNVSPNDFGNFSGSLTAFVCNSDDQGIIITNIDKPGNYLFKLDFKEYDYSISTVIGSPSESLVSVSSAWINAFHFAAISLGASGESSYTNYRNQIQFIPVPGDDSPDNSNFDGAIDNVSLTSTYLINQGGEVENWVIEGVGEGTNEIVFNDGAITFNNAAETVDQPEDVQTYIYQTLPVDLSGSKVRLKFDYTLSGNTDGLPTIAYIIIGGSGQGYFSSTGNSGGLVDYSLHGGTGTFDNIIQIPTIGSQGFFPNQSIVFFPVTQGTNATIDNIVIQQLYSGDLEDLTTVSFSEDVKGWVSFKSFLPESGLSLNNKYYTFKTGGIWAHDTNDVRNNFYGDQYKSSFTAIINDYPSTIKDFRTLNYEGSQSKVLSTKTFNGVNDSDLYNQVDKEGWTVTSIMTDLEEGSVNEFLKKEGKWFNYIKGKSNNTDITPNIYGDVLGKLNFQGLGQVSESSNTSSDDFEGGTEDGVVTSIVIPPVTIVDTAATETSAAATPPPPTTTTTTTTTQGGGY